MYGAHLRTTKFILCDSKDNYLALIFTWAVFDIEIKNFEYT